MKFLLVLIFTLLSINTKALTVEDEFLEVVQKNYETYSLYNKETSLGTIIIARGIVNNEKSFSLFFLSKNAKTCSIEIIKNKKEYSKKVNDLLIYYNILEDENTYIIKINSYDNNSLFYEINLDDITENTYYGLGENHFPSNTVLKNEVSRIKIWTFVIIFFVLLEGVLLVFIFTRKKAKQKELLEKETNIEFVSHDYEVEEKNEAS